MEEYRSISGQIEVETNKGTYKLELPASNDIDDILDMIKRFVDGVME